MDKMQKLDEILKTYEEEMTETLRGLVRIPSVDGEPLPGKPFGEACARALDYALKKAEKFGFETVVSDIASIDSMVEKVRSDNDD